MRIIKTKSDLLDYFESANYTSAELASGIDSLVCLYAENGHPKSYNGYMEEALEEVWDGEVKGNANDDVCFKISDKMGMSVLNDFCKSEYGQSSGLIIERT